MAIMKLPLHMTKTFVGTKPIILHINDVDIPVNSWRYLSLLILRRLNCIDHEYFLRLCGNLSGAKRYFFHSEPAEMDRPIEIDEGIYFESHFGVKMMISLVNEQIRHVDYDSDYFVTIKTKE